MCWDASRALGLLAIALTAVGLLIAAIAERSPLGSTVASVLPESVRAFFETPAAISYSPLPGEFKERVQGAAPVAVRQRGTEATFTIGSSEEAVLRSQGRPGRPDGGTWFYGDSEVHFVAGRVVSWKNSSRNPLKLR